MNSLTSFHLGLIEGFYGHTWSWQLRREYAKFLAQAGYQSYIYAPKSDAYLRKQWASVWPQPLEHELRSIADSYHQAGLFWGVGLSPFEVYRRWPGDSKKQLQSKIQYLNKFDPDILLIAFDDMRGDQAELARIQCEIMDCVLESSAAKLHFFCPTYYSYDPVLTDVFGDMPRDYWAELGERLDTQVQIFWTGNQVCSQRYAQEDFTEISSWLRRKPALWDNYPVNDGRKTSPFLHLDAFRQRPAELSTTLAAHYVNPMNAGNLSKLPLLSLPQSYRQGQSYDPDRARLEAFESLCATELASQLARDWQTFQYGGLDSLDDAERASLRNTYALWSEPVAQEIVQWLDGYYVFDPACLTG